MKKKKIPPKTFAIIAAVIVALLGIIIFCLVEHGRYQDAVSSSPPPGTEIQVPGSDAPGVTPTPDPMTPPAPGEEEPVCGLDEQHYLNNKVLTAPTIDGGTFSLGVDMGPGLTDALYLSPTTSFSTMDGVNIGYYISSNSCPPAPQYGAWVVPGTDPTKHDYYLETTYDVAKPATYINDEEYGVLWTDNRMVMGGEYQGADIYIRAVDIGGGELLGTYKATITYDKNSDTYALSSLENTDVLNTGYLTAEERTELLSWCYDLLHDGGVGHDMGAQADIQQIDKETALAHSIVERVEDRTYFPSAYSVYGTKQSSSSITGQSHDAVAVNLDCGSGFFTFYFSSAAPTFASGFDLSTPNPSDTPDPDYINPAEQSWWIDGSLTSKQLNLAGWDIYFPQTMDHLAETYFY